MRLSPARGFRAWTALLLLGLAAGTAVAAERFGARVEIYSGAAGGLLLGLVGHLFAALAVAPGAGPASLKEEARRWRNWAIGLFLRFALLTALAGTFWLAWRERFAAAMLSLAAVWLALHFWEICWLCRRVQGGAPVADALLAEVAGHQAGGEPDAPADPMEHAGDYALCGVGADGRFRTMSEMYDRHGQAVAGYQPVTFQLGPVQGRLEFTRHMLDLSIIAALLALVLVAVARRVLANVRIDRAPHGPLANAVEFGLVFVRDDIVAPIGGRHLAAFTPLYLTYFFFILLCNLSGMVPKLFKGPTSNLAVTGALAATVLIFLMTMGIIRQGPVGYFKSLVPAGIPWLLWPMIFAIEFLGSLLRCVVLAVRLFANMLAGHLILPSILGLGAFKPGAAGMAVMGLALGVPLALGVNLLELLICLIQAYVFTMLSVIFTSAAVHPEH